jgi:hypothetical protein
VSKDRRARRLLGFDGFKRIKSRKRDILADTLGRMETILMDIPNPFIAAGVTVSTALTDAVYVLFTSAVSTRRRIPAANWSSLWYVLSAFAVISYTGNSMYVVFAALGSWLGAFGAVTWLKRKDPKTFLDVPLKPH